MKRKYISLLIIGLILLAGLALAGFSLNAGADADAGAVAAANQLYVAGHYAEAAQIYEEQIAQGVQDSTLYYNLGNAYFQQGDMGRAALNLQRAAHLDPRDPDIQANLELVRQQTTELFAGDQTAPGTVALLADATGWLTQNETAVLVLGLWFALVFLLLARRTAESERAKRALQATAAVVLILLLVSGISLASRSFVDQSQPGGLVVTPSVAVSSGLEADVLQGPNNS